MADSDGKKIKQAIPSAAVEVLGLNAVPNAGDQFQVVKNDKQAREIADYRVSKEKEKKLLNEELQRTKLRTLQKEFSGT